MYKTRYIAFGGDTTDLEEDIDDLNITMPQKPDIEPNLELESDDEIVVSDQYPEEFDVGLKGLARGKLVDKYELNEKLVILIINSTKTFDNFTNVYGYIENQTVKIHWDKVSTKYDGIGIEHSIMDDRYEYVMFNDVVYKSWWKNDFVIGKEVPNDSILVFIKTI